MTTISEPGGVEFVLTRDRESVLVEFTVPTGTEGSAPVPAGFERVGDDVTGTFTPAYNGSVTIAEGSLDYGNGSGSTFTGVLAYPAAPLPQTGPWLDRIVDFVAVEQQRTVGRDIFQGGILDRGEDDCLGFIQYDGALIARFGRTEAQPFVQVRVRGEKGTTGATFDRAWALWHLLDMGQSTITGIAEITPIGLPIPAGGDTEGRPMHTINFRVTLADEEQP